MTGGFFRVGWFTAWLFHTVITFYVDFGDGETVFDMTLFRSKELLPAYLNYVGASSTSGRGISDTSSTWTGTASSNTMLF
jgi:hypothetical protein